jgi:hypothetical protein
MDSSSVKAPSARIGGAVTLVTQRDGAPFALQATLRSSDPPMVTVPIDPMVKKGESVLLLAHEGTTVLRAQATIADSQRTGSQWTVELAFAGWEHANRRRADRYEVELDATVETVLEGGSGFDPRPAKITELSKTGAWVQTDLLMPRGALVKWQFAVNGASARGLALVIRSCPVRGGMALEFVEFIGSAYGAIDNFLDQQAA